MHSSIIVFWIIISVIIALALGLGIGFGLASRPHPRSISRPVPHRVAPPPLRSMPVARHCQPLPWRFA